MTDAPEQTKAKTDDTGLFPTLYTDDEFTLEIIAMAARVALAYPQGDEQ